MTNSIDEPQIADQIAGILRDYIQARGVPLPEGEIASDTVLADFGFDSIDKAAMVIELENHFNLSLERRAAASVKYFSDLVALVAIAQQSCPQPL